MRFKNENKNVQKKNNNNKRLIRKCRLLKFDGKSCIKFRDQNMGELVQAGR